MYKALTLDYYGTLVHEDDAIITGIVTRIVSQSPLNPSPSDVGQEWYNIFMTQLKQSEGPAFRLQKDIELEALNTILTKFQVQMSATDLSEPLFRYWSHPTVFDDAVEFLKRNTIPYLIVSNIDNKFIHASIKDLGIAIKDVITSEDCRSYKPNSALYRAALDRLRCKPDEVLHVGDSVVMDFEGAEKMGIDCAFVNRKGRAYTFKGDGPKYIMQDLSELDDV